MAVSLLPDFDFRSFEEGIIEQVERSKSDILRQIFEKIHGREMMTSEENRFSFVYWEGEPMKQQVYFGGMNLGFLEVFFPGGGNGFSITVRFTPLT